jgi:Flp pilus assembly protein protease CpaA
MKTTDVAEIVRGANDEVAEPVAERRGISRPVVHADLSDPHGVDGPDELAAAIGQGFGGVLVAIGLFGAADVGRSGDWEKEGEGGSGESGSSGEEHEGGAGNFRLLSGNKMTAQVWIAILVGLAASVDDLARRRIANWIPAAALAGGFGWQIGQNGFWPGAGYALLGSVVGFLVFLIFYLLGGVGGLLAVLVMGGKAAWRLIRREKREVVDRGLKESIPYAPAITLGVWLALVPKG